MKISEIITEVDAVRPGNKFTTSQKIDWISNLDAKIYNDIVSRYNKSDKQFVAYLAATQDVIAHKRYQQMYVNYVMAQMDYFVAEYSRFNNDMVMFNAEYSEFERDYIRRHMMPQRGFNL